MKATKKTAAVLLLMTAPALTGAAALQDTATATTSTHTKSLLLHEQTSHRVGKGRVVGTDKILSPASRDVIGFDSFTAHFTKDSAVIQAAFALKGGIIVVRAHAVGNGEKFKGTILNGTGVYSGISGTVAARGGERRTLVTLTYTL